MNSPCSADTVLTLAQDGTLTDSIQAVEAAWGKVAKDIGQDPAYVIAATHGKRAVDNLAQFKPYIKAHEMDAAVQEFEESILYFADAFHLHGPGSQPATPASWADSGATTPDLSGSASLASSRASSFSELRRCGANKHLRARSGSVHDASTDTRSN